MRQAIFISIRNKSSRLPEKSFLHLADLCSVDFLLSRLKSHFADIPLVIATSDHSDDTVFVEHFSKSNIHVYCGSQNDKLLRYLNCAESMHLDQVVIVDGDDLFVSTLLIKELLNSPMLDNEVTLYKDCLPLGMAPYRFSIDSLREIVFHKKIGNTEVWGDIVKGISSVKVREIKPLEVLQDFSEFRLTLDYPEDLIVLNRVWTKLKYNINFTDLELLEALKTLDKSYLSLMRTAQANYINNINAVKMNQK